MTSSPAGTVPECPCEHCDDPLTLGDIRHAAELTRAHQALMQRGTAIDR